MPINSTTTQNVPRAKHQVIALPGNRYGEKKQLALLMHTHIYFYKYIMYFFYVHLSDQYFSLAAEQLKISCSQ